MEDGEKIPWATLCVGEDKMTKDEIQLILAELGWSQERFTREDQYAKIIREDHQEFSKNADKIARVVMRHRKDIPIWAGLWYKMKESDRGEVVSSKKRALKTDDEEPTKRLRQASTKMANGKATAKMAAKMASVHDLTAPTPQERLAQEFEDNMAFVHDQNCIKPGSPPWSTLEKCAWIAPSCKDWFEDVAVKPSALRRDPNVKKHRMSRLRPLYKYEKKNPEEAIFGMPYVNPVDNVIWWGTSTHLNNKLRALPAYSLAEGFAPALECVPHIWPQNWGCMPLYVQNGTDKCPYMSSFRPGEFDYHTALLMNTQLKRDGQKCATHPDGCGKELKSGDIITAYGNDIHWVYECWYIGAYLLIDGNRIGCKIGVVKAAYNQLHNVANRVGTVTKVHKQRCGCSSEYNKNAHGHAQVSWTDGNFKRIVRKDLIPVSFKNDTNKKGGRVSKGAANK